MYIYIYVRSFVCLFVCLNLFAKQQCITHSMDKSICRLNMHGYIYAYYN